MLGKKPARKNRYKKSVKQRQHRWVGHLATGLKLLSLIAVLLAASALFMVGYAAVTQSDYFRAQAIAVEGFSRLSRDTITLLKDALRIFSSSYQKLRPSLEIRSMASDISNVRKVLTGNASLRAEDIDWVVVR